MPQPDPDDDVTQPILVRYDIAETPDQRKRREKLGLPTPTYAFMCQRITHEDK